MAEPNRKGYSSALSSRKRSFAKANEMDSPSDSTTCSDFGDFGTSDSKIIKRERNRQIAKNNRERKKEEARELQENVLILKRKIQSLQNELALRPSFLANDNHLTISYDMEFTSKILNVLEQLRNRSGSESTAFFVINAASHFFPIVCASPAFAELTGFSMQEIIGQNCGFLSGQQTSRNERERLNLALQQGQDISATLLNYRKDGSTFWNNVHFANLSTVLHDGELAPYIIVGLHTEVFSRKSTLVDCGASDNGASEDNGNSPHSQQSQNGAYNSSYYGAVATSSASYQHGQQSSSSAAAGAGNSSAYQQHQGEQDAASCVQDDEEHTILQEILSNHLQGLSTAATGSSEQKRTRREAGSSASAHASSGPSNAVATSSTGALDHYFDMPLKGVPLDANHIFAFQHQGVQTPSASAAVAVPEMQSLSLSQQRSNSVMSSLTTDGTDGDTAASPVVTTPQGVTSVMVSGMVASTYNESPTAMHYPACTTPPATRPAPAARSDSFHSLSPAAPTVSPGRGSTLIQASRFPTSGHYPAIEGLPQSALRNMSGSAFNSPAGSREVPPFVQSMRRVSTTARSPAPSPSATELRRSYFSALEDHFTSESAAGVMDTGVAEVVLSSPTRQPVPSGAAFTPTTNTAFQPVRRATSSTGTTAEALSVASTVSSAHIFRAPHPIVTDGLPGDSKSSPRGSTPKRVSCTNSKGEESPISSFELLYSHKHAPAALKTATVVSGSSAGNRLRATSDAAMLDGAEELVLAEQHEQVEGAGQESDPELAAYMMAPAQVRFAPTAATASAASVGQPQTGAAGSASAGAGGGARGTVVRGAGPHETGLPATPQATAQGIRTRLSTPRYFYH